MWTCILDNYPVAFLIRIHIYVIILHCQFFFIIAIGINGVHWKGLSDHEQIIFAVPGGGGGGGDDLYETMARVRFIDNVRSTLWNNEQKTDS